MPLVYQENIDRFTRLGLWHITEQEDFFAGKIPLSREISHPHKRLQHLAGRCLLRELFPGFPLELIKIADTKKPYVPQDEYHFSISHCGDYAAVIVSQNQRVGIDIELPRVSINNIRSKFLSDSEFDCLRQMHADVSTALTIGWSTKESLFKWYGKGNVDFRKDMQILSANPQKNELVASFGKGMDFMPTVPVNIYEGLVLTYVRSDY